MTDEWTLKIIGRLALKAWHRDGYIDVGGNASGRPGDLIDALLEQWDEGAKRRRVISRMEVPADLWPPGFNPVTWVESLQVVMDLRTGEIDPEETATARADRHLPPYNSETYGNELSLRFAAAAEKVGLTADDYSATRERVLADEAAEWQKSLYEDISLDPAVFAEVTRWQQENPDAWVARIERRKEVTP